MATTDGEARLPRSRSYEDEFPVRLRKASDALEEVVRLLLGDTHGLGFTEMRLLAYLAERPRASVGEISRDLRVDKAWISRLLQALGGRQMTIQTRDHSDSRIVLASLTDAGRAYYEKTIAAVTRCDASIMEGVDEDLASALIARIEANLRSVAQRLRSEDKG